MARKKASYSGQVVNQRTGANQQGPAWLDVWGKRIGFVVLILGIPAALFGGVRYYVAGDLATMRSDIANIKEEEVKQRGDIENVRRTIQEELVKLLDRAYAKADARPTAVTIQETQTLFRLAAKTRTSMPRAVVNTVSLSLARSDERTKQDAAYWQTVSLVTTAKFSETRDGLPPCSSKQVAKVPLSPIPMPLGVRDGHLTLGMGSMLTRVRLVYRDCQANLGDVAFAKADAQGFSLYELSFIRSEIIYQGGNIASGASFLDCSFSIALESAPPSRGLQLISSLLSETAPAQITII
ncbi:hypothetical protein [Terriglobus aquaticus]|uniref:Uncharacterized protein n=1 Tax=Terriglobus aquaticus TaxID=940139 RepID=A0ABW9KII5_9BACT|nr:hypothetical protein [Terriglobus aquaticus]